MTGLINIKRDDNILQDDILPVLHGAQSFEGRFSCDQMLFLCASCAFGKTACIILRRRFTRSVQPLRQRRPQHMTYTSVRRRSSMNQFRAISVDDVITAVHHLPDKSSAVDPLPTYVLKQVADLVAPYISELFNRSLAVSHFRPPSSKRL